MKKLLLSGVALAALTITPALGADLPRKAPAYLPPAPPPFSWTGFYVGGSVGVIGQDVQGTDFGDGTGDGLLFTAGDTYSNSNIGVIGGINAGYNWQFASNWVIGIEADISGTSLKGNNAFDCCGAVYSVQTKRSWHCSRSLRLCIRSCAALRNRRMGVRESRRLCGLAGPNLDRVHR